MRIRAVLGWLAFISVYVMIGSMESGCVDIVKGSIVCVILLGIFAWGGIPWHKKW